MIVIILRIVHTNWDTKNKTNTNSNTLANLNTDTETNGIANAYTDAKILPINTNKTAKTVLWFLERRIMEGTS